MIGRTLNNRYKLIEKIGEGGMALVFLGYDELLEREVAVKILRPQFVTDENFIRLFQREARAAASLNHPRIVNVYDIGQDGETYYLVMENIKGINLKEYIKKGGPANLTESLRIIEEICEALVVAHRNNLIHCDIKPHNILLTERNGIKVTDFGIARAMSSAVTLTNTQSVLGSAHYISPEQAKGDSITPSCDIYSLGVVTYELITGQLPFQGENPISIALKHIRDNPVPPSRYNTLLPSFVEQIIMRALAKNVEDRYITADAMLQEIRGALRLLAMRKEKEADGADIPTQVLPNLGIKAGSGKPIHREKAGISRLQGRSKSGNLFSKAFKNFTYRTGRFARNFFNKMDDFLKSLSDKIDKKLPFWAAGKYYIFIGLIILLLLGGGWAGYKIYMDVPIIVVPDLTGYSLEEAREKVKKLNLELTIGGDQYHDEIPRGAVVSQYPDYQEEIRAGRNIAIILSSGPLWSEVPSLINLTVREAEIILSAADLEWGEIEFDFSEEIERDKIISQSPEPGEEIKSNAMVNVLVSKGSVAHTVRVPNLLGLSEAEAGEILSSLGLELGSVESDSSTRYLKGQISSQDPLSNTPVLEDSKVNIVLSTGIINKEAAPIYPINIRIPVPAGKDSQEIRIIAIDNNGEHTVYREDHKPGDRVFQRINTVGPTIIKIYIDNTFAREERFGF